MIDKDPDRHPSLVIFFTFLIHQLSTVKHHLEIVAIYDLNYFHLCDRAIL